MISIKVLDVKKFMEKLFIGPMFDNFLILSGDVKASISWHIEGDINNDYYSSDELEIINERKYALWSEIKPVVFNIIKGKKTPSYLKIVFMLSDENITSFATSIGILPSDVGGIFLNIKYDSSGLNIITGSSQKTFSLDKTLEQQWDQATKKLLFKNEVSFE
ncbi:MAG: hypothetical protein K0R15_1707 [Clostridiales bacterium]|jgi:single-stranded DNA-specific DHH superfamily exonuclease|nr:hypothetical protein [Clostridiales bacterium]